MPVSYPAPSSTSRVRSAAEKRACGLPSELMRQPSTQKPHDRGRDGTAAKQRWGVSTRGTSTWPVWAQPAPGYSMRMCLPSAYKNRSPRYLAAMAVVAVVGIVVVLSTASGSEFLLVIPFAIVCALCLLALGPARAQQRDRGSRVHAPGIPRTSFASRRDEALAVFVGRSCPAHPVGPRIGDGLTH